MGGLGDVTLTASLHSAALQLGANASDVRDVNRVKCLLVLKKQLMEIIGPYVTGLNAILLDQVFHWNLGDSFIEVRFAGT